MYTTLTTFKKSMCRLLLFAVLFLAGSTPLLAYDFSATNADGQTIYYNIISSNEVEVTSPNNTATYIGSINIPSTVQYNGSTYNVTAIGYCAFYGYSELTAVNIPDGVTSIGIAAFYCDSNLTSVTIPNSVSNIDSFAFYGCSSLISVNIPTGITTIKWASFYDCASLISINIPNTVTSIEGWAFRGCTSLTSINIPNSVTSIGRNTFCLCTGFTTINIPNSVVSLDTSLFYQCSGLTSVNIPSGVVSIGPWAFYGCSNLTSVNIPNNVTAIRYSTFNNCSSLTAINIPNGVTIIDSFAFYGCSNLVSANIPSGITTIKWSSFYECSSLDSITIPNGVTTIENYAFRGCSSLTSLNIPSSVTSIGNYAFYNCDGLSSVSFASPGSLDSIGAGVFSSDQSEYPDAYKNIRILELPSTVTYIGSSNSFSMVKYLVYGGNTGYQYDRWNAQYRAGAMDSLFIYADVNKTKLVTALDTTITILNIPNSVTEVYPSAFENFTQLNTVNIPGSVKSLGYKSFYNCTELTSVSFASPSNLDSIHYSVFNSDQHRYGVSDVQKNIRFLILPNTVRYIGSDPWDDPFSMVQYLIYGGSAGHENERWGAASRGAATDSVFLYADTNKTILKYLIDTTIINLTIPASVTQMYSYAFYNCTWLNTITILGNLTTIDTGTFYQCYNLTSINIPNSVTSFKAEAFFNCVSLDSIHIPNGVTSIESNAFNGCMRLLSLSIPGSVTSIGEEAFYGCNGITSVSFATPSNLEVIGREAFGGYSYDNYYNPIRNIRIMELPNTVDTIGYHEDYGYISENESTFSMVEYLVYSGSAGDENYTWGAARRGGLIDSLFIYADTNKTKLVTALDTTLTTLTIPNTVVEIYPSAFQDFSLLNSVTFPDGLTTIGRSAFYNCTGITSIEIPSSVISIRYLAFYNCTGLTSVTFDTTSSLDTIGSYAFSSEREDDYEDNVSEDRNIRVLELPSTVSRISEWAFSMVKYLVYGGSFVPDDDYDDYNYWGAVYKGGAIDSLYLYDDMNKTKLMLAIDTTVTNVTIPSFVTEIMPKAFMGFTHLNTLIVPDNVTLISDSAFLDCTSLDSMSLGTGLYSIGKNAFTNCINLSAFTSHRMVPPTIAQPTFVGVNKGIPVYVPGNFISQYQTANFWFEFFNYHAIDAAGGDDNDDDDTACDPVLHVAVNTITGSSAVVAWTSGTNNTGNFEVEYGLHGFAHGEGTAVQVSATSYTLNGLAEETEYDVYVRAVCGEQNYSAWSTVSTFTTTIICDPITDITVDASTITNNGATVAWTPGENNSGNFEVEYGTRGFAHGEGTAVQVSATSYALSGLTANSEYDVYIRAICGEQNVSEWSNVYTFRTSNVGIDAVNSNSTVTIYPNPAEQSTTIRISGMEDEVTVTIVDMNGSTVCRYTMECNGDCEKMIDVDGLAAGNYFVRMQGDGFNTVKKLIVK